MFRSVRYSYPSGSDRSVCVAGGGHDEGRCHSHQEAPQDVPCLKRRTYVLKHTSIIYPCGKRSFPCSTKQNCVFRRIAEWAQMREFRRAFTKVVEIGRHFLRGKGKMVMKREFSPRKKPRTLRRLWKNTRKVCAFSATLIFCELYACHFTKFESF